MKKPNDMKKPNNNGGSMGQTLRKLEKYIHVSVEVGMEEVKIGDLTFKVPTRTPKGKGRTYRTHSTAPGALEPAPAI